MEGHTPPRTREPPVTRLRLRALALALAAPLALAACGGGVDQAGTTVVGDYDQDRPPAGDDGLFAVEDREPAPAIRGEALDGTPVDVTALRGKVVVLNFWADWCGPCRAEAPFLNEVYAQTRASGVEFVGINVKDDRGAALRFEERMGVEYPSIYDQPAITLTRFRSVVPQTPPSTLLLDRQGRVAGILNGGQTVSDLLPPVQALAAEAAE